MSHGWSAASVAGVAPHSSAFDVNLQAIARATIPEHVRSGLAME